MSTLTADCVRHPSEPAKFRCRQCNDNLCVACRAPSERDLCDICGQYRRDAVETERRVAAGLPTERVRPKSRAGVYLIGLLVVLNLAFSGYLLFWGKQEANEFAQDVVRDVQIVSRTVEESKDAQGRYPASLNAVLDRLPEPSRDMVRSGVVRYQTDEDRTTYEVTIPLGPRGQDTSKP
ncbi:MAG: hypothetical protein DME10_04225 [Candidatus Rokuibacteriota bacterium]|nr:MAG: hypothetical protein DME10_04225 [Candidatus Rokubacteria bacterium]